MKNKNDLRTSIVLKQKLRVTVAWIVAGVSISVVLGIILFFVFYGSNFSISDAGVSKTYETVATGLWTSDATWKNEAPEDLVSDANIIINEGHEVTMPEDYNVGANANLEVSGTLVFREDLYLNQSTAINVLDSGIFIVMGDYFSDNDVEITNDGRSVIIGDITKGDNTKIINNETLYTSVDPNSGLLSTHLTISDIEYNDPELKQILEYNGFSFSTLPIKLGKFEAKQSENKVVLKWTTLDEINNDYFTILRSSDGKKFDAIGNVNGAGNSKVELQYSFTDFKPLSGTSYYMLKQTDFDGQYEYFKPTIVERTEINDESLLEILSVGPNPFQSNVNIKYNVSQAGSVEIQLMNLMGERVFSSSQTSYAGVNSYQFTEGDRLQNEIYILNLKYNGKSSKSLKIVKR